MVFFSGNFYLYRTSGQLRFVGKHFSRFPLQINSVRHLRGTRLGKNLNREEAKYRNLLKTLREESDKPVTYTSSEIPVEKATPPPNDAVKVSEKIELSVGNLCKKLEEKITPLKDLIYTRQLEKKYNKSLSLLRVFGEKLRSLKVPIALGNDNLPCPVELTVPSPLVESYRNQDEFSIGLGLDGNPKTIGFYTGSNVDSQNAICLSPEDLIIIKESHKEFVKDFQNYLKDSPLAANVRYDDGGYWRSLKVRSNVTDELMGVITMHPQELTKEKLFQEAEKLREYFIVQKPYYLKSLYLQTNLQRSESSDSKLNLLFGDSYIVEDFNNLKIQITPNSFFSSNTKALESAYKSLMKICRVKDSTTILDIFCGTGPLSLMMSSRVQRCIGIDNCSSSVKDARANAIANNKHNVEFYEGNPDYLISEILSKGFYEDVIAVINPGRAELSKTAVKCLRACKYLKKIVYISTKPKIAVDNYLRLCRPCGGEHYLGKYFVPILAVPVDLFPQTDHYGLIVMFQRL